MANLTAPQHNLYIERGATFAVAFVAKSIYNKPIDLTGQTVLIRVKFDDTGAYVFDSMAPQFADCIHVSALTGRIDWSIPAVTTANLVPSPRYAYDVFLINGAINTKLAWGQITVTPSTAF